MSVYFFYGDEDYNIELEINALKSKLLDKNFASINFKSVDNPPFVDLISYLRTQPMMFGNQMIVINCESYFAPANSEDEFSQSFDDYQISEIESALKNNAETLCVIFVYPLPRNGRRKVDTRRKIYKVISKYAECKEFSMMKDYLLSDFVKKIVKKQKLTIENDACDELVSRVGNNLRELVLEVDKLQLMVYPDKKITKKAVKDISISNEYLFAMTENILKRNKANAILEYRKLTDKKHPLEILAALQTMMRKWIMIKIYHSQGQSVTSLIRLVGQPENRIKDFLKKDISLKELVDLKQKITNTEYRIKSGAAIDAYSEFESAIF